MHIQLQKGVGKSCGHEMWGASRVCQEAESTGHPCLGHPVATSWLAATGTPYGPSPWTSWRCQPVSLFVPCYLFSTKSCIHIHCSIPQAKFGSQHVSDIYLSIYQSNYLDTWLLCLLLQGSLDEVSTCILSHLCLEGSKSRKDWCSSYHIEQGQVLNTLFNEVIEIWLVDCFHVMFSLNIIWLPKKFFRHVL